ncbi:MAG: hypothetical protein WBK55_00165 [Alphaproteobacteria bacterium]
MSNELREKKIKMHIPQKPPFFAAFALAVNALISGPDAALANKPSAWETASPTVYKQLKARYDICDPRAIKFTVYMFQTIAPRHPEKVPEEFYESVREIFRASANEMFVYTRGITETPMENDELVAAVQFKYNQLANEHRNKLDVLFEKLPTPYSFNREEFGRIDVQLDADSTPNVCASL